MQRMRDLREIGSNSNSMSLIECSQFERSTVCPSSSMKRKRSNMSQAYENMRKKQRSRPLSKLCEGTRVIIPSYWVGPASSIKHAKDYSVEMDNNALDSPDSSSRSTCDARGSEFNRGGSGANLENGCSDEGFYNVPLVMGDVFEAGDYLPIYSSYAFKKNWGSSKEGQFGNSDHGSTDSHHNNLSDNGTVGPTTQLYENSFEKDINKMEQDSLYSESTESETDTIQDDITTVDLSCSDLLQPGSLSEPEPEPEDSPKPLKMTAISESPVNVPISSISKYNQIVKPLKSIPMQQTTLYEVELHVKASYSGPHVPLVSLMSKLNGKAIVGHPVSVEPLRDGSLNHFVSMKQLLKKGEKVNTQSHSKSGQKSLANNNNNSNNSNNNNKKIGFSPRKMRRLSSITVDHRREREEERKLVMVGKLTGPTVACVPLRIVFSRINEALKFPARLENP